MYLQTVKKSVRFSEKSEPVFFQKGSSPSSQYLYLIRILSYIFTYSSDINLLWIFIFICVTDISSGIPRPKKKPVNECPSDTSNNIPHISESITPNVKSRSNKNSNTNTGLQANKGPVVANHNISISGGDDISKPSSDINDIRLDKTPTDDEIEVLWDRVRNCLLESPANSVRSAPGQLQHATQTVQKQPTGAPKQPIKKVSSFVV